MSSGPFRLDGGEFEPDTWPTRYSVGEGRRRTMKAMVAVEPEVLSSLLDDPTWAEQLKGDKPPAFDKAKAASIRWRERWRLFESWCWEWACDEIRMRGAKARGDKLIFTEMRLAPAPLQHESFRFEPPAWDPAHEQWKDYLARVSDSFVEYRNEYRMRVEGAAKQARYVRTAQIWNDDQFFWLARRHLHAEKYVDMARNGVDLTPKQISVAVRRLAQYVGFHHKAYPIRVNRQRNIGARGAMFPKFDTDFEPRAQSKDNGSTMSGPARRLKFERGGQIAVAP